MPIDLLAALFRCLVNDLLLKRWTDPVSEYKYRFLRFVPLQRYAQPLYRDGIALV
jgi:hypothetical protein